MALDIITALQGGTCAIIQTECCVFIPDESANVSSLLNCIRIQSNALSDPTLSLGDLINQWLELWSSWWKKKLSLILGIIILSCIFLAFAHITALVSDSSAVRLPQNELPPC